MVGFIVLAALIATCSLVVSLHAWRKRDRDLVSEFGLRQFQGKVTVSVFGDREEVPLSSGEIAQLRDLLQECQYTPGKGRPAIPLKMPWQATFYLADSRVLILRVSGNRGCLWLCRDKADREPIGASYEVPPRIESFVRSKLGRT